MSCVQSEHPKKHLKTRGRFGCASDAVLSESVLNSQALPGLCSIRSLDCFAENPFHPANAPTSATSFFSSQLTSQSRAGLFTVELWIDSPVAFAAAAL